jgi:integrase/recombinase XerC
MSAGGGALALTFNPCPEALLHAFLQGRNPRTIDAYRRDLQDFLAFVGGALVEDAARLLLMNGHGAANAVALAYKSAMVDRHLAAATINRRLSALRSLVKLARTVGLVSWSLEVESVRGETYRDTRGPGDASVRELFVALAKRRDAKGVRDMVLVRLLFDLALRRGEVVSLDVEHVDLKAGTVAVLGKGRQGRAPLTLPRATRAALEAWLAVRGPAPGPLFGPADGEAGARLTGRGLHKIITHLGAELDITLRPHGLRHAAITTALDATRGDVRSVQRFSRHKDVRVLMIYDDNRADVAGGIAALVSSGGAA